MKKTKEFFYGWIIAFSCFLSLFLVAGVLQTFSVYLIPISTEFGWDRTLVSSAMSVNILAAAAFLPFVGKLVEKYNPKKVMLIGVAIMGLSTILLSMVSSSTQYFLLNAICGLGFSGAGIIPSTVLLGRWFYKKKGTAMSIALSGFPFSTIILIPLSTYLISTYGWRTSYLIYGSMLLIAVIPIILILIKSGPEEVGLKMYGEHPSTQTKNVVSTTEREVTILEAVKTRSFLMLIVAFFFCGFDVPVVMHFAAFVQDIGLSALTAASVLSLLGVFDLLGTITIGPISDRLGRKNLLSIMYLMRAFSLFLILGTPGVTRLYAFAVPFGFTYFGMMSIISAWIAENYGTKSLGKLTGFIIPFHSVAVSFGTFFLGFIFDAYKSYYWGFFSFGIFAFIAFLAAFLMKEKRGK